MAQVPLYPCEQAVTPCTVCVTGVSGYLGSAIVARLLLAGHRVHGTVRDVNNAKQIQFLKDLPGASSRLRFFRGLLTEAGSFDEAVAGCDYVIHVASPLIGSVPSGKEKELLLDPAVQGVENVLAAVNRTPSVRRVVFTSSGAAVYGQADERGKGHVFTEEDWNITSSIQVGPYLLSKLLAEKKAWEIHAAQSRWELVVLNPLAILGPPVGPRTDNETLSIIVKMCNGAMWPLGPAVGTPYVDVRDVAAAHCVAMLHPAAKGRYILCAGSSTILELAQLVRRLYPGKYWLPRGLAPAWLALALAPLAGVDRAFLRSIWGKYAKLDSSKAKKELGITFMSLEDTMKDTVDRLRTLGAIS